VSNIIDFIHESRSTLQQTVRSLEPDSDWAIIVHLLRARLLNRPVSITEHIRESGLPYGTASRRIQRMVDDGLIEKRIINPGEKRYELMPSSLLWDHCEHFIQRIKVLFAQTIGMRTDAHKDDEYVFGERRANMAGLLPPRTLLHALVSGRVKAGPRFLFHSDSYFSSLRNLWVDIRSGSGRNDDFELAELPDLYEAVMENTAREVSAFDVVALNLPWIPEFISKELVLPADHYRASADMRRFHPAIWDCASWGGEKAGVPLYITVEALAVRTDLFEETHLYLPRTPTDVLASARLLQRECGVAGLSWNGARGSPIASAFMFFLNDHGGAVVRARAVDDGRSNIADERRKWCAMLESDAARSTLAFMQALLKVSAPGVLQFDGERTMHEFMVGRCAMAYVWSMRAARFEFDLKSVVKGRVKYLARPNHRGAMQTVPVGGFLLAIPSNLPPERIALAAQAIDWMTSSGARASLVQNGLPLVPEVGVSSDADFDAASPLVNFVKEQAENRLLDTSMRPWLPVYHFIEEALGEEIHDALTGITPPSLALTRANQRIEALLDRMA
jgi:multiple sugar transport system substrate-binding protein